LVELQVSVTGPSVRTSVAEAASDTVGGGAAGPPPPPPPHADTANVQHAATRTRVMSAMGLPLDRFIAAGL